MTRKSRNWGLICGAVFTGGFLLGFPLLWVYQHAFGQPARQLMQDADARLNPIAVPLAIAGGLIGYVFLRAILRLIAKANAGRFGPHVRLPGLLRDTNRVRWAFVLLGLFATGESLAGLILVIASGQPGMWNPLGGLAVGLAIVSAALLHRGEQPGPCARSDDSP